MKKNILLILLSGFSFNSYSQDSTLVKINEWLKENKFSVRKTFDGSSKDENKPASLLFRENYKSNNDFLNVDLAIKLSEFEFFKDKKSSLIIYPKVEWHKSTDSTDIKNKLDGGFNFEFIPFKLKASDIPDGLPNEGLKVSPWIQGTSSFKQNFIDNVFETKLSLQLSLVSTYQYFPGYSFRDKQENFVARYYPYFGIEYNYLPDLISDGEIEEFSTYFFRFFTEIWVMPQTVQINLDGTYREIIDNNSQLRKSLPILSTSLVIYPGKQESLGIGFEYKYGYDTNSKFQLVQISSLSLSWKI